MFPTALEYNRIIQSKKQSHFKTINNLVFIPSRLTPIQIYTHGSGAFATVFKATDYQKYYAIRFFLNNEEELFDRYKILDIYLNSISASWITKFIFLENELKYNHSEYPVLKMEWIEGLPLNRYIEQVLYDNEKIIILQNKILTLSRELEQNKVGHGDIQCSNLIIVNSETDGVNIKLIDYDGMYIPEFSNMLNLERGRSEFQTPTRTIYHFDEKIDRFSFWIILCALEALKYDKTLWLDVMQGGFNTQDNLLFVGADFANFQNSELVKKLYSLRQKSINFYLDKIFKFVTIAPNLIEKPEVYEHFYDIDVADIVDENIVSNNNVTLKIISEPTGAVVLTSDFKRLGTTPLALNKNIFVNKSLIIALGTQIKQINISETSDSIEINFNSLSSGNLSVLSISSEKQNETIETSNIPESKSNNDYISFIALFMIPLLISAVIILFSNLHNEKQESKITKTDPSTENKIDSTISTPPEENGTNITIIPATIDTLAKTDSNSDTLNEKPELTKKNEILTYTDDFGKLADQIVTSFLEALGNRDCQEAWNHTYVYDWEKKGKSWFCSSSAFGSISKLEIKTVLPISFGANEADIFAEYYAEDFINGNKCYKQKFVVKKTKLFSDTKWLIIHVNNLEIPFDCRQTR